MSSSPHRHVSIIIPVYNDAARLRLCLDALSKQDYPSDKMEAIVIDNGSDEPPRELVEGYPFGVFSSELTVGSFAARNQGLRIAKGEVIVFTDADCLPESGWLTAGVSAIDAMQRRGIVGGRVVVFPLDPSAPTGAELYDIAFGLDQPTNIHKAGFSVTANLFVPRIAIEQVGPFNQEMLSGGDDDWCRRATEHGFELAYEATAVVRHPARSTVKELTRQARRFVGGRMDRKKKRSILTWHYWQTVARKVIPNFARMNNARIRLAERGYQGGAWIRTIPVILVVQYAKLFEYVRKLLGFSSERQ